MAVAFDADTGRLRLDDTAFAALAAWADGDQSADIGELREAGVIQPDAPHPAVAAGLGAVIAPVCRLELTMTDHTGRREAGEGWINSAAAALLLDLPDGFREFVTLAPMFLPAGIARIVRLGPRPRPGFEILTMDHSTFDGLMAVDPTARHEAASALAGDALPLHSVIDQLPDGPWRCWCATMTWPDRIGGDACRELHVLDTDAGLCLVDLHHDGAALWPNTATGVWRRIIGLFPSDAELDESSRPE